MCQPIVKSCGIGGLKRCGRRVEFQLTRLFGYNKATCRGQSRFERIGNESCQHIIMPGQFSRESPRVRIRSVEVTDNADQAVVSTDSIGLLQSFIQSIAIACRFLCRVQLSPVVDNGLQHTSDVTTTAVGSHQRGSIEQDRR